MTTSDARKRLAENQAPSAPSYFEAPDGGGEPTIWRTNGDWPLPVVRRCDLDSCQRGEAWPLIVAALCGPNGGSHV